MEALGTIEIYRIKFVASVATCCGRPLHNLDAQNWNSSSDEQVNTEWFTKKLKFAYFSLAPTWTQMNRKLNIQIRRKYTARKGIPDTTRANKKKSERNWKQKKIWGMFSLIYRHEFDPICRRRMRHRNAKMPANAYDFQRKVTEVCDISHQE